MRRAQSILPLDKFHIRQGASQKTLPYGLKTQGNIGNVKPVAGRQSGRVLQAGFLKQGSGYVGHGLSRIYQSYIWTHHILEQSLKQGVMGASQNQGVDSFR